MSNSGKSSRAGVMKRVAALSVVLAGVGLVAFAAPQISQDKGGSNADGDQYTLRCWQEGTLIVSETHSAQTISVDIRQIEGVGISQGDGARRSVVALGDSMCIIDTSPE